MRLVFVVLHLGGNKLEAVVEDTSVSRQRRIAVKWQSRTPTDIPPFDWVDVVRKECDYQRTRDQMREEGRVVPDF